MYYVSCIFSIFPFSIYIIIFILYVAQYTLDYLTQPPLVFRFLTLKTPHYMIPIIISKE